MGKDSYRRTKFGVICRAYSNMKMLSKKRGMPLPSFTKDELKDWAYSQKIFHELYDSWKLADYNMSEKPSFDRISNFDEYKLSTIKIMPFIQNVKNNALARKNGNDNRMNKSVLQLKDNKIVGRYHSGKQAERVTGILHVHEVCRGGRKQAGGYIWKYDSEKQITLQN